MMTKSPIRGVGSSVSKTVNSVRNLMGITEKEEEEEVT
jgi:hypothetical protein